MALVLGSGCTLPSRVVVDDADTGAIDVTTADVREAGPPSDAMDASVASDASDAMDVTAATDAVDAMDSGGALDAIDASDAAPADGYSSTVLAPRPIGPPSGSIQTGNNVTLEWSLPAGTTGAIVELCADRACARPTTRTVPGPATTLALTGTPLHGGWNYWRVRGTSGALVSATPSPTWQLYVPPSATSTRRAGHYGAVLDYNGDGVPDVAIGDTDSASVFVYRGSATGYDSSTPSVTLTNAATPNFGAVVASAGDVDGNGFADLLVIAQGSNATEPGPFASALLYRSNGTGYPGPPDVVPLTSNIVRSASWAGDVNHDGYADVVIGAITGRMIGHPSGEWYVVLGSPAPITTAMLFPNMSNGYVVGVSGAGDVDGDGFDDFAVAAVTYSVSFGPTAGYLVAGGATLSDTPALTFTEPGSEHFNGTVAGGCDFDQDGWPDIAFGLYAGGTGGTPGVQRYHNAASGAFAMPFLDASLNQANTVQAIACGGDVNGDGYDDVVFSVAATSGPSTIHVLSAPHATATSAGYNLVTSSAQFGGAISVLGDYDGDGLADVAVGGGSGAVIYMRGAASPPYLDTSFVSVGSIGGGGSTAFGVTLAALDRRRTTWWPFDRL